jgi:hypothetical protein
MRISVVKTSETKLRFLASILSLGLAVGLSGCGDEDAPDPAAGSGTGGGEQQGEAGGETAGGTGSIGTSETGSATAGETET